MKSEAGTLCMRVPSRHCSADLMDSLVVPWQEIFFITDSMEVKERPFHKAASLICAGTEGDLFRILLPSSSMPRSEAVSRSPWRLWNWRLFGWALSCASCVEGCENDPRGVWKLCKKTQPGTWHFTWCCLHSLLLPPWLVYRDGVGPHLNFLSQHQQADSASKESQGHQKLKHVTSCIRSYWQWTSFCWPKFSSGMWCMICSSFFVVKFQIGWRHCCYFSWSLWLFGQQSWQSGPELDMDFV